MMARSSDRFHLQNDTATGPPTDSFWRRQPFGTYCGQPQGQWIYYGSESHPCILHPVSAISFKVVFLLHLCLYTRLKQVMSLLCAILLAYTPSPLLPDSQTSVKATNSVTLHTHTHIKTNLHGFQKRKEEEENILYCSVSSKITSILSSNISCKKYRSRGKSYYDDAVLSALQTLSPNSQPCNQRCPRQSSRQCLHRPCN